MRSFKKFVIESIEQAELDEAVEVRHDRYMRSHGKKASGGTGSWMFTHKAMGDVDHKNEKEVYSAPSGKFSDAKKAAQQWAKKHGHSTVYVMESVELDEANKNIIPDRELNNLVKSKKAVYWRSSGFNKLPNDKFFYIPILDKNKKMLGVYKANANDSDQEYEYLDSMLKDVRESVELDEVSDKMLDRYRQKAFADQPSGDDGSDKYRKRKFGRDLAFAKQTGRAKVLATKEEVELDEVSTEKLRDYASAALQDKDKAKADKRWKYASKAMKTVGDREAKAAHARKYNKMEETQLDEKAPKIKPDFLKTQREKDRAHDAAMGRTATGRKKPVRQMTSTQRSLAKMRGESEE